MKYRVAFFISISCMSLFLRAETEPAQVSESTSNVAELAHADPILDLVKDREIPTPIIEPTSPFKAWLISLGISLRYKMFAIKNWFSKKSDKKESEAK